MGLIRELIQLKSNDVSIRLVFNCCVKCPLCLMIWLITLAPWSQGERGVEVVRKEESTPIPCFWWQFSLADHKLTENSFLRRQSSALNQQTVASGEGYRVSNSVLFTEKCLFLLLQGFFCTSLSSMGFRKAAVFFFCLFQMQG